MRYAILLLASALLACGGSSTPAPNDPSESSTSGGEQEQEQAREAAPPVDAVQIQVLDPGSEPRQVLRYHIPEGATEQLDMTQRVETTIILGGQPMGSPTAFPIATRMSFGPASSSADGNLHLPFRIDSMELGRGEGMTEATQAAAAAAVAPLVGTTGAEEMDARGRVTNSTIDVPEGVAPAMAETLENMRKAMVDAGVPFPEQAVGVGARWQVRKHVTRRGLLIETVSTYTLRELNADGGRFDAVVSGSAPPQPFPPTGDDSTAELQSMTLRGGGESTFSFRRMASTASNWVEMDMEALIRAQGQAHGMQMHMRQTITIAPVAADAPGVVAP